MKYLFDNKELNQMISLAGTVKKDDTKIVLILGGKDEGENVLCGMRVSTDAEQIQYKTSIKKPAGWDNKGVQISVSASKFIQTASAVLSYNEDVFLEPDNTMLVIGVEGKVKVPVELEAEIPQEIPASDLLFRFQTTGSAFSSLIRKGLFFGDESDERISNAVLHLRYDENVVRGYSSDGYTIGRSEETVNFIKDAGSNEQLAAFLKAMDDNLNAYCEKSGQKRDGFNVLLPHKSVLHLLSIIDGQKGLSFAVDDKHLILQIGDSLIYTIVQGRSCGIPIERFEMYSSLPAKAVIGADSAVVAKGIDFINTVNGISGTNNMPTVITVEKDGNSLRAVSGVASQIESVIKTTAFNGDTDALIRVDGKRMKAALNALSKGNVVIAVSTDTISICNGTIDSVNKKNIVTVILVRDPSASGGESAESSEE